MRLLLITSALAMTALLAGCGGGDQKLSARATADCLTASGIPVSRDDADYIALSAAEGGYLVSLPHTGLNIAFERNPADAERTRAAYEIIAKAFGIVEDKQVLYTDANAVFAWDDTPTASEKASIHNCLRSSEEAAAARQELREARVEATRLSAKLAGAKAEAEMAARAVGQRQRKAMEAVLAAGGSMAEANAAAEAAAP